MTADAEARVAVVTGAARGLGRSIAGRFLAQGYCVAYADSDAEANAEAVAAADPAGERALPVQVDVRDNASVQSSLQQTIERWGHVDVWVNNAALTAARPFLEIEPDEWDDVIATNLRGTFLGCQTAGTHMCERGYGRIINLASVAGQWGRSITGAHYAASKAGIISVTRTAAMAFAASGVTVNAIAPGPIDGPAVAAMPLETVTDYVATIPARRLGKPEEIAALAGFLASADAGFTTGATYDVNGGILMR